MISKKLLYTFIFLLVAMAAVPFIIKIILGNASAVELSDAPGLSGQISQSMAVADAQLPEYGRDYTLKDITFFHNNDWVVTQTEPVGDNAFNAGFVVMQKKQGILQIVLGPAGVFPKSVLQSLPDDVATYLDQKGAVYEPVN